MDAVRLEDLPGWVGRDLGVSDWLVVTQAHFDGFATVTGDHAWIHVDVPRATREMGGTIAHGFFTLSLIPVLAEGLLPLADMSRGYNYGCDKVRFPYPVRVGMRLRLRQKLLAVEPKRGGLQLRYESVIEIEGEAKPACVAETLSLVYGHGPGEFHQNAAADTADRGSRR